MKYRRFTAVIITLLLLLGMMPEAALAAKQSTDTFCSATTSGKHSWRDWKTTKEPTCTKNGKKERTCGRCGYTQTKSVKALGHNWGGWKITKEATCAQQGLRTRKCSRCGEKQTETIKKASHKWSGWKTTKEATCTSTGEKTRKCSVCGKKDTEAIQKADHKWSSWKTTKKASCTSTGEKTRTCSVCGKKETRETDKLPHNWSEWTIIKAATDFSMGTHSQTCQVCGEEKTEDFYPDPTYKKGDKGDGVKALQEKLNAAGYNCGTADGDFGKKTEKAVSALESDHGVTADGIAWPGVQKWLEPAVASITTYSNGDSAADFLGHLRNGPDDDDPNPLRIVTQPVGGEFDPDGDSMVLSVEVTGGEEPYRYQWYRYLDFIEAEDKLLGQPCGDDAPEYPVDKPGKFYCKITDSAGMPGSVYSNVVEVTSELFIAVQPQNTNLHGQESVTLTCEAAGGVPFPNGTYIYAWYDLYDNQIAFSDSGMANVTEPGEYYCMVQDHGDGLLTSETCTVYDAEPLWVNCDAKYAAIEPGVDTFEILMNFGGGKGSLTCEWYIDNEKVDSHPANGSYDSKVAEKEGIYTLTVVDEMGESESCSVEIVDQNIHIVEQTEAATISEDKPEAKLSVTIIGGNKPYKVWWYWEDLNGKDGVVDIQEVTGSESVYEAENPGKYYCIAHSYGYSGLTDASDKIPVSYTGGPYILEQPKSVTLPSSEAELRRSVTLTCRAVSMDTGNDDALEYTWEVLYPNRTTVWDIASFGSRCDAKAFGTYCCVVTDTRTGEMTTSDNVYVGRELEYLKSWREGGDMINKGWIRASYRGGTPPYHVELYARVKYDTLENRDPYPLEEDYLVGSWIIEKEADLDRFGKWDSIYYTFLNYRIKPPRIEGHLKEYYYVVTDVLGQVSVSDIVN